MTPEALEQPLPESTVEESAAPMVKPWAHPTGNSPQTVCIVALGPTKQTLLELTTAHQPPPEVMDVDEVWGLNGGVNHLMGRTAYDVLWCMDWIEGEERKEPKYGEYIRRWYDRHKAPIITSQATGPWSVHPGVHEFPLQEILSFFGIPLGNYFHNSIPYLIAYALWIKVRKVILFGADYSHEAIKRREEDRPNAEYWVGAARMADQLRRQIFAMIEALVDAHPELAGFGKTLVDGLVGMEVKVGDGTTLLNTNRGQWFYGYRDQPVIRQK